MPADTQTMYAGIIVRMSNASDSVMFPHLVTDALTKIAATPTGMKLVNGLAARSNLAKFGYTVCIMRADMRYDPGCVTRWVGTNVAKRGDETAGTTRGQASVTAIKYNANMIDTPDGKRPSWVGLAHELIHAYYNLKGKGRPESEEEFNVSGNVKKGGDADGRPRRRAAPEHHREQDPRRCGPSAADDVRRQVARATPRAIKWQPGEDPRGRRVRRIAGREGCGARPE